MARLHHSIAGTACFALALLAAACADKAVAPAQNEATPPPQSENVYVVIAEDDIVLNGRLFGGEHDVAVVLSHMRPNDQTAWYPFAEELAASGYAVLTYNFRGYATSEGAEDFEKLDDDLEAMIDYLRGQGKTRIFVVGASMGGTTSIVVAAREDLAGVVAISAPAQFEDQDATEAIARVTEPALLLVAEGDTHAKISMDEMLEARPETESELYSGNLHGTALFEPESEHATAVRERLLTFLEENRGP